MSMAVANGLIKKGLGKIARCRVVPDVMAIRLQYWINLGKTVDLENPTRYNEKIQWLKLNDRNPLYTQLADKVLVKEWVASIIGEEHIVPTYKVWNSIDEINISELPNEFVLKTNHDSGGVVVCRDKRDFDFKLAKKKLEKHFKKEYFYQWREWPYKDIKPKVFAEQFIPSIGDGGLIDYKFFCFNGRVKYLFVATERNNQDVETKFDFYDADFEHLNLINGHPNAKVPPQKPVLFEEMKYLAAKLSEGIPHVRVDFYCSESRVLFGEMTFHHWSGLVPFEPDEWDYIFGKEIHLPSKGR